MTDTTPNLGLPELVASQAQKHVTHNEALRALDAIVQLAVLDRDLAAPPLTPDEGERFIVAAPASGDWAGHSGDIAAWQDNGWQFYAPQTGWLAYVVDEGALLAFTGATWVDAISAITSLNNMTLLGVGTTADAANPFSAKLNNILWTARTVGEGGDGDLRWKMSKQGAADTLSMLFQTNASARAEIGLTGDDDLHVKMSPDGSSWIEALTVDRASGGVRFLAAETNVASAATCDIGAAASLKVRIAGAATIVSFGTAANCLRLLRFAGSLTLTHNATALILPNNGDNIVTAAGDTAIAVSDNTGNWRVIAYQRASGAPVNYETGTFTPTVTLVGGAGNVVPVYATNTGRYTRIGNRVWVDIFLNGDGGAEGAGTGFIEIALPFAASASFSGESVPAGNARNGGVEYMLQAEIQPGASVAILFYFDTPTNRASFTGDLQNATIRWIRLQFSYEV